MTYDVLIEIPQTTRFGWAFVKYYNSITKFWFAERILRSVIKQLSNAKIKTKNIQIIQVVRVYVFNF